MSRPVDHPACRHCGTALPRPIKGYFARRGFCGTKCEKAYVPVARTQLCANVTCKRGTDGARAVFHTFKTNATCCCRNCFSTHYQRQRSEAAKAGWQTRQVQAPPVVYDLDLPAAVIERKLEALARRRKETRSWLRIDDPWQQRSGSELHKQTTVETYSLEGAML